MVWNSNGVLEAGEKHGEPDWGFLSIPWCDVWPRINGEFRRMTLVPKRRMSRRHRGYLLEVPLLLAVTGIALAVLFPLLPPVGQKVAVAMCLFPVLMGSYYLLVVPGWTLERGSGPRVFWRLATFLVLAGLLTASALFFILQPAT